MKMAEVSIFILVVLLFSGFTKPCEAFHVDWNLSDQNDEIINLTKDDDGAIQSTSPLDHFYIHGKQLHLNNNFPSKRALEDDPDSRQVKKFTKDLLTAIAKRTSYANSQKEIHEIEGHTNEETRGAYGKSSGFLQKRNDQTEYHSGGCAAQKTWISLGADHFPRFVKSYNCSSETCDGNVGECRPKSYAVKVLRMKSIENISMNDEGCDPHLPEQLRCDWNLEPVIVTTYCECISINMVPFTG